jgi:uncharacterized protein
MNSGKMAMFLLGASLALGFAFSAKMLSNALIRMRQYDAISVKGMSQTRITSDLASWQGEFSATDANMPSAYKILEGHRSKVASLIARTGFGKETTVEFLSIGISPKYELDKNGRATNKIESYILTQAVSIASNEPLKVNAISKSASELIADGIEFTSGSPSYTYSGIEKVKLDLLAEATRNGYERASALAANANGKLGSLASASQGVFQITALNSTDTSGYGEYDTSTIDKLVKAVVTLEFKLGR